MATKSADGVFGRIRTGSKVVQLTSSDADVREDEEQSVKLTQTVDLLLAAGYFRARIRGLEPFDKVVGGMVWCITTCSFDVDVDLLFQENSTIGQKIALTERIVAVLPLMKCPHRIEPHQIQGLDFIHIFPVMQWLVKRAITTREELGDYIRHYSVSQFNKHFKTPQDEEVNLQKQTSTKAIAHIKHVYRPQRRYRRNDALSIKDEATRVQSTLLEYGRGVGGGSRSGKSDTDGGSLSAKKSAVEAGLTPVAAEEEEQHRQEDESRIAALMSGMSAHQDVKITARAVGSIVGMQSEEIQQMAAEYADKQAELSAGRGMSGSEQHKRTITGLQKEIDQQNDILKQVESKHASLSTVYEESQQKLDQVEAYSNKLHKQTQLLQQQETGADPRVLSELRSLVAANESLKKQEQEFRSKCKEEMARFKADIAKAEESGFTGSEADQERHQAIDKQHEADLEKLQKARLILARKIREIASLQRRIDEVPSRAELSQYQRRFVELYDQIAGKHKETKQFYTLYNTLDDTKLYLNKETALLNSIHDNFEEAMSSLSGREQYLKQLDTIVEGVRQNRLKCESRWQEEKMRRDQLNDQHLNLVEKQRQYFKTVKDFMEECRKNEILQSRLSK